ncbi:transmembrane protein, putative [Medicago truncatula]|uniref:Transmembrane protein, putative n=1 Tax=Medicago truncatula TaxID=3880 RepID=A0A072UW18_MEDTR|nr:transmembrane protein, putative [Medicago truncatula]
MGKSHHWAMKALTVVAVVLKSILCVVFDVVGDAYSLDLPYNYKGVAEANKRGIIRGCVCKRGEEEQVAYEVGSGLGHFKWETARVGEAMEEGEVDSMGVIKGDCNIHLPNILLNGRNF